MQDSQGRWNQYTGRYAWDEGCVCCGDEQYGGTGHPKEGSSFGAAPNVDHSNGRVRKVTGSSPDGGSSSYLPSLHPSEVSWTCSKHVDHERLILALPDVLRNVSPANLGFA